MDYADEDDFLYPKSQEKTTPSSDKLRPYNECMVMYVRYIYVLGIILWIFIIYIFELYQTDILGWLIIFVPVVVFLFGYFNACVVTGEVEDEVFRANYLSIGLLIVLPLLTWVNKDYKGDRKKFVSILVLAIILTMFSMIDIWVNKPWLSVVKHGKSVLQTTALVLMVYALYTYYITLPHSILSE